MHNFEGSIKYFLESTLPIVRWFLSRELCSTGSMLLWRHVHSWKIWDLFQCIERFVLQWRHMLTNTFHQSHGRHGHVRGRFWRQCGAIGFDNSGLEWVAGKVEDENRIGQSDIQTNRTQHLLGSSLGWRTCHGGSQWQIASANAFRIKPGRQQSCGLALHDCPIAMTQW